MKTAKNIALEEQIKKIKVEKGKPISLPKDTKIIGHIHRRIK